MKNFLLIVGWEISAVFLFWGGQGLVRKIESLEVAFEDERKDWVGEEVYFLSQKKAERLGRYIGFCWNPEEPRSSTVEYEELVGKRARIEEAWWGSVASSDARGRRQKEDVVFWKMRLIPLDKVVWYWDNGSTPILGVGFVGDYEKAKHCVGDSFWVKNMYVLYTLDDEGVVRLRNLQRVVLDEVRWGEYANYPLKFVLRTGDGQVGYRFGKNLEAFLDNWYRVNPRQKYKGWDSIYWDAIEGRRVTSGMDPEMVVMAWGQQAAKDTVVTDQGIHVMLWVYPGVKRSIYGLFFVDGKLVYWQWKERKHVEEDILRYELAAGQISVSCDVRINWRKMVEEGKDFVTFSW